MKLDDKVLDDIVVLVKRYCQKQDDISRRYCANIARLEDSWCGTNFDDLEQNVKRINSGVEKAMEGIEERYAPYFQGKAEMIRNRPAFSGGVVSGKSSSGAAKSATSSGSPKTVFDKVFQGYNEDCVKKIYTYLRKINFCKPNEKTCYYDPNGKSKKGLYKNIMAIDINSTTFQQDMRSLTGQHLFFQMQHSEQMKLIKCLGNELKNNAFVDDIEYCNLTEQIKSGNGIETKYITFPNDDIRTAFSFFTKAFEVTVSNNNDEIDKYKKYYSNSYSDFVELLHNLGNFK